MLRLIPSLLAVLFLVACTADHKWASDADVARAHYVDPNPPSITLMTAINTRSNEGAHSGLLINAGERVLYDPAGSWEQPLAPEREDLHYGMTPQLLASYADFQGTAPFQLVQQTIYVSPEIAQMVMNNAIAHGSANKAACSNAISQILRTVPGFEPIDHTLFPKALMRAYGKLPGVHTQTVTAKDGDRRRTLPGQVVGSPTPVAPPLSSLPPAS